MTLDPIPFRSPFMTVHAICVGIAAGIFNGIVIGICNIEQPMAEAIPLSLKGAGGSVGHVTGIALFSGDPIVFVMPRRQCRAIRVAEIVHERLHDVTGRTGFHSFCSFHDGCSGGQRSGGGQDEKEKQKDPMISTPRQPCFIHVLDQDQPYFSADLGLGCVNFPMSVRIWPGLGPRWRDGFFGF